MATLTAGSDAYANGVYLPFDILDIWIATHNVDVQSASFATTTGEPYGDDLVGKVDLYGTNLNTEGGIVQTMVLYWNNDLNLTISGLSVNFDTLKYAINNAALDGDPGPAGLLQAFKKVNFELDLSDSTVINAVSGVGGSDIIKLGSGEDTYFLDGGKDLATLGAGNDTIYALNPYGYSGKGRAEVDGGKGIDTVSLELQDNADAQTLDLMGVSKFNKGTVEFKNVENVLGGLGADTILATNKANVINGGQGEDVITGRGGADTLTGGIDADTFVYAKVGDSGLDAKHDIITDFSHGEDTLDFSLLHPATKNDKLVYLGTDKFDGGKGELHFKIYNEAGDSNDHTIVEVDMNGDKTADLQIYLNGIVHLTKQDFML